MKAKIAFPGEGVTSFCECGLPICKPTILCQDAWIVSGPNYRLVSVRRRQNTDCYRSDHRENRLVTVRRARLVSFKTVHHFARTAYAMPSETGFRLPAHEERPPESL